MDRKGFITLAPGGEFGFLHLEHLPVIEIAKEGGQERLSN
jgi:hypothetical protein